MQTIDEIIAKMLQASVQLGKPFLTLIESLQKTDGDLGNSYQVAFQNEVPSLFLLVKYQTANLDLTINLYYEVKQLDLETDYAINTLQFNLKEYSREAYGKTTVLTNVIIEPFSIDPEYDLFELRFKAILESHKATVNTVIRNSITSDTEWRKARVSDLIGRIMTAHGVDLKHKDYFIEIMAATDRKLLATREMEFTSMATKLITLYKRHHG